MNWSVLGFAAVLAGAPASSFAADRVVSVGAGAVTDDPFIRRRMVSVGYEARPEERVSIGANVLFAPDFGDGDWKPITKQLIEENNVSPDISKLGLSGRMVLTVFPVQHREATFMTKVGFATSVGVVRTSESLEALDAEQDNERAVLTQNQTHPCFGAAISAEVWWDDGFGIRMRRDGMLYIETVNATQLEMKNNGMFIIDLLRRF